MITGRNLNQGPRFKTTATKVMIQIASKMGAEPWRVTIPPSPPGRVLLTSIIYNTVNDKILFLYRNGWWSGTIRIMTQGKVRLLERLLRPPIVTSHDWYLRYLFTRTRRKFRRVSISICTNVSSKLQICCKIHLSICKKNLSLDKKFIINCICCKL